MNKKELSVQENIDEFNSAVADYIEDKIELTELEDRVSKLDNRDTHELLARTGNSLVSCAMECIESLSYYTYIQDSEGTEVENNWLKKYYNEFKAGIPPYETELQFSYNFKIPNFNMTVEYNQEPDEEDSKENVFVVRGSGTRKL